MSDTEKKDEPAKREIPDDHYENDCAPNPKTKEMMSDRTRAFDEDFVERMKAMIAKG